MKRGHWGIIVLGVVSTVFAKPVVNDAYYVEPYATGFQNLTSFAFGPGGAFGYEGELFAVDAEPALAIYRVPPEGNKVLFAKTSSLVPHSAVFPPVGSVFEGYLYIVDGGAIRRYDTQGNATKFASVDSMGQDIVFGMQAGFGDYLFHADSLQRAIRRWTAPGKYTPFAVNMPMGLQNLAFGSVVPWV